MDAALTWARLGCVELNPPFHDVLMLLAALALLAALSAPRATPLSAVLVLAAWPPTPALALLAACAPERHACPPLHLAQSTHAYQEGAQHTQSRQLRLASADSVVYFLHNDHATPTPLLSRALRTAMETRFREAATRAQQQQEQEEEEEEENEDEEWREETTAT